MPHRLLPHARRMLFTPRGQLKMDACDRRFLVEYYAEDIRRLADLIGRDLNSWLVC